MAITAHMLLTYTCPLRCNHCFVFSSPKAQGKFIRQSLNQSLNQIGQTRQIDTVVFGGGEPFLEYTTLLFGVKKARQMDLRVIIITNGFFARNHPSGLNILRPIAEFGIHELQVSIDEFHFQGQSDSVGERALEIAEKLGVNGRRVCVSRQIGDPKRIDLSASDNDRMSTRPLRYFGRAVGLISESQPRYPSRAFTKCPEHNLTKLEEIYLDPGGVVSVCPGIAIGNLTTSPLSEIIENYPHLNNPILQNLISGGPAELARQFPLSGTDRFTDACHACFLIRKALLAAYPDFLTPKQVYGLL